MADFLYYWKRYASDVQGGLIYKLNQNSPTMERIRVGDDVFAFGLRSPGVYSLFARFTVTEVGENDPTSRDAQEYGKHFFKSCGQLTTYFQGVDDVEDMVRTLSVRCEGAVLGQCFQGQAAVRELTLKDREKIIRRIADY